MSVTLQKYLAERVTLMADDRSQRLDFRRHSGLTDAEIKADRVIRDLRAKEASSVWNADYDSIPHPFPGMEFLTGKSIILNTKLYQVLTKLPKGGLLHVHLDASVDPKFVLSLALTHPSIHIRVPTPLTSTNLHTTLPELRPFPANKFTTASSLSTDEAGIWVPLLAARENFDVTLGGKEGFDKWVIGCMTINPAEAYGTHNTVVKIWQKFQSTFGVSAGLIRYSPIWSAYIKEFLLTSIDDGIFYIEARVNFLSKFMYGPDGVENVPHREWMASFVNVVNEVKEELKARGREDEFIGAKVIYTTLKVITPEELEWYLRDCIELKKEFPDFIAGFDLVGGEDSPGTRPLKSYLSPLLRFRDMQEEAGVEIPYLLHAGETLGDGTDADENLYDALLLGTKRIGHGFSIVKHPRLMDMCKERGIALEVCPISNEILRLTSSMPMHPLPIMLNNGIAVALSSDDPAVFGSMGLTYDFYQVLVSSEINGLITLGELARSSIQHSMMKADEKARALCAWEGHWSKFVDEIVRNEGSESRVDITL